jgi:hypothetical protein
MENSDSFSPKSITCDGSKTSTACPRNSNMKMKARVRSQENPSVIFDARIDIKTGVSPSTSAFLISIILSNALILSSFSLLFSETQAGEDWECENKGMLLAGRKKEVKVQGYSK